ncbi:unnamed protein product [Dovyalis caffra]|uniref:Uncharacterized protein n=1 Tax=Dovyalis caffra TaxID=77055 RepID=A0AAV1RHB6_9ROSI|nr:unnamed protein product [Dovyalis caffra]
MGDRPLNIDDIGFDGNHSMIGTSYRWHGPLRIDVEEPFMTNKEEDNRLEFINKERELGRRSLEREWLSGIQA